MKNILNKFKINNYTYLFIFLCLISGYLKNITIIMSICLFHELGHIFFIKLFKYEIVEVEILPFGGYTLINKKINSSIYKDLIIAFGGILFQIILIIIIMLLNNHINIITYNLLIKYNIILILFNLIPIIPLDGNNIIHLLLERFFSFYTSYYLNFLISIITIIIFILINYIYNIDNYFIITFLIYKIIMYLKNYKYISKRFLLERYLYNIPYKKIDNHTKSIKDLKKEVYHYFKNDNKYISERVVISNYLTKPSIFGKINTFKSFRKKPH